LVAQLVLEVARLLTGAVVAHDLLGVERAARFEPADLPLNRLLRGPPPPESVHPLLAQEGFEPVPGDRGIRVARDDPGVALALLNHRLHEGLAEQSEGEKAEAPVDRRVKVHRRQPLRLGPLALLHPLLNQAADAFVVGLLAHSLSSCGSVNCLTKAFTFVSSSWCFASTSARRRW